LDNRKKEKKNNYLPSCFSDLWVIEMGNNIGLWWKNYFFSQTKHLLNFSLDSFGRRHFIIPFWLKNLTGLASFIPIFKKDPIRMGFVLPPFCLG